METDKLIKQEITRLNKIFADIPKEKQNYCIEVITNMAFLSVQMKILRDAIVENGAIETYQNGQYQSGLKESSNVSVYDKFHKLYTKSWGQLIELLPKGVEVVKDDGFDDFIND